MQTKAKSASKPHVPLARVYASMQPAAQSSPVATVDLSEQYISTLHAMSHAEVMKALKNPALKPSEARTLFERLLPHQRRAMLEERAMHEFSASHGMTTAGYDAGSSPFSNEAPENPRFASALCVRAIDASNTFGMSGQYNSFFLSNLKAPNDSNWSYRSSFNNAVFGNVPSYFKYDSVSTHWYWTSARTSDLKIFENVSVGQIDPGLIASTPNTSPPLRNWVCNVTPSASYALDSRILRGACPGSY